MDNSYKPFKTTIYRVPSGIFVPTRKRVEQEYVNGRVGEQLWGQVFEGLLNGNLWTENEILALSPSTIEID